HVTVEYTCPMHPEVVQNEPGSCPKCGMNLEPRDSTQHDHAAMESGMDHSDMEMGFMSMIEMTKDLPRSGDGLPMEWIDVPFGPFFPGLPGGLLLMLTLDGDTVAGSNADTLVGNAQLLIESTMDIKKFVEHLGILEPLAPICYQVLACLAIENAAGVEHDEDVAKARVVAMERERILSHLGWLVLFGQQTGFCWLLRRATRLKRDFLRADMKHIPALKTAVNDLIKRLSRTPLLKSRTFGIGKLFGDSDTVLLGPVARASGIKNDARSSNKTYKNLGFTAASGTDGDARARLMLRLDEICYSLELIEKVGFTTDFAITVTAINDIGETSSTGEAVIETARGLARLQLRLDQGQVVSAHLETPSTTHLALIEQLTAQQELGDALVAVGSLDLSPWEIRS
ncbi:MAG: heavy metal-binding domain-containing protein, partial [Thiohalomonadales bacterium]